MFWRCNRQCCCNTIWWNRTYTYLWSNGKTTSSITNLYAGVYTLTVTDQAGCVKTVVVTITTSPLIVITQSQTNVTIPGGSDGTASASVSGGVFPYTYHWNTNPVMTTASVSGLHAGIYKLLITDNKGWIKKATYTITEPGGRVIDGDEGDNNFNVSVSPNPSSGRIALNFEDAVNLLAYKITFYDLTGRIVFSQTDIKEGGNITMRYDVSMLSKGIYFL